MRRRLKSPIRLLVGAAALLLLGACGPKRAQPLSADAPPEYPPSLAGRTVMVLPAQGSARPAGFDAELAHFLAELAPGVRWVPVTAVERAAESSPTLRIRPHDLAVADFTRMRVTRIGEPLFSDLHALGVLLDARYSLLPWSVRYVAGTGAEPGRVEVSAALIDNSYGDVLWLGLVPGQRGAEHAPATVASAASALAERMAR